MGSKLSDVDALERVVGKRPLASTLKSIDFLDSHCESLLAVSRFAVVGYQDSSGNQRCGVVGGAEGFAKTDGERVLVLPTPSDAQPGTPYSTMFLIRGWREALRINGRLDTNDPTRVHVDEAFVHCGKAILRAELWRTPKPALDEDAGSALSDAAVRAFLSKCRYIAVSSHDADGFADTSPKGDPAGFVQVLDDQTIAIPDRPGNRRTDTFHNLLTRPACAVVCLNPGDARVLELGGEGHVTNDRHLLRRMAVNDKVPKAALVIRVSRCQLTPSPAFAASQIWDPAITGSVDDLPRTGTIWSDHVRANQTKGVAAAALRAGATEGLMIAGIEMDYKTRLY